MGLLSDLSKAIGATINPEGAAIDAYIEELCKHKVQIGFNEDSGSYDDGTTVAQVAAWNEYGTETAPARPFMRQTVDDYEDKIIKHGQNQFKTELKGGKSAERVLNAMGSYVKGCIQKEIVEGEFEPNAPSTIAKKHSERPLIDSSHMRQSVTYVIK